MYILTTVKRCSVVTTRQEGLKSNVGKSIFFIWIALSPSVKNFKWTQHNSTTKYLQTYLSNSGFKDPAITIASS